MILEEDHLLTADGDSLRLQYSGAGDSVIFKMFQGLEVPLDQIGTHLFAKTISVGSLPEAIFSYDIEVTGGDSTVQSKYTNGSTRNFRYIGVDRDTSVLNITPALRGRITETEIESQHIGNFRGVTTYFPKSYDQDTPIMYVLDGSSVKEYAPYVDHMISRGQIRPVILIGSHSAVGFDRYHEYVYSPIEPDPKFVSHLNFFTQEVMPYAEDQVEGWRGDRYLFGVSNGAAFALYLGIVYAEYFDHVWAYATYGYINEIGHTIRYDKSSYPEFYITCGIYDENSFKESIDLVKSMKAHGIDANFKELICAHDFYPWKVDFLEKVRSELR